MVWKNSTELLHQSASGFIQKSKNPKIQKTELSRQKCRKPWCRVQISYLVITFFFAYFHLLILEITSIIIAFLKCVKFTIAHQLVDLLSQRPLNHDDSKGRCSICNQNKMRWFQRHFAEVQKISKYLFFFFCQFHVFLWFSYLFYLIFVCLPLLLSVIFTLVFL